MSKPKLVMNNLKSRHVVVKIAGELKYGCAFCYRQWHFTAIERARHIPEPDSMLGECNPPAKDCP